MLERLARRARAARAVLAVLIRSLFLPSSLLMVLQRSNPLNGTSNQGYPNVEHSHETRLPSLLEGYPCSEVNDGRRTLPEEVAQCSNGVLRLYAL